VLASQGDFAAHAAMLRSLGAEPTEVRNPTELDDLDGLVIPGGESTTITKAIERDGLEPAIRAHVEAGRPLLGTCAGMIICDRDHLGLVDATARRNAFGRQIASFEAELEVSGLGPDPRPPGRGGSVRLSPRTQR
jgi:5'-phosphate synthase pdxT subunit